MQEDEAAEAPPKRGQAKVTGKGFWMRKRTVITVTLAVVLIGIIVAGILTKRIAFALTPNTYSTVVTSVCTNDDVNKFNTLIQKDYSAFATLMKDIATRPNYKNDASCVFMQYRYFYEELEYSKAVEMANRYKELVAAGHYGSSAINYDQSILLLDSTINTIRQFPDGKGMTGGEESDY